MSEAAHAGQLTALMLAPDDSVLTALQLVSSQFNDRCWLLMNQCLLHCC